MDVDVLSNHVKIRCVVVFSCRSLSASLVHLRLLTSGAVHGKIEALMAMARYETKKFNGKSDFGLWRIKMKALLIHQGLADALTPEEGD